MSPDRWGDNTMNLQVAPMNLHGSMFGPSKPKPEPEQEIPGNSFKPPNFLNDYMKDNDFWSGLNLQMLSGTEVDETSASRWGDLA